MRSTLGLLILRRWARPSLMVAASWMTLLAACGERAIEVAAPFEGFSLRPTRGYIFISLDALRADHLGVYGYERNTSPFLDSLVSRALVFDGAMAPYPSTLVSNASLFTGLYPPRHGVYPPSRVVPESIETMPERFKRHGFRTQGHAEGGFMAAGYGFARGFERYTDFQHLDERDLERTLGLGLEFLRDLADNERFFLFLHSYVTHDPYAPPEPYRDLFWEGDPPPGPEPIGPVLRAINAQSSEVDSSTLRYWEALYDGSIRYADDQIEDFFNSLVDYGLAQDTTVIITSDHGEEFHEHGAVAHTQIYPECLRIPLLIIHPDLTNPVRIPWSYSVVDLAPTLYDLAGIGVPEDLDGTSVVPFLKVPGTRSVGGVYAEVIDRTTVRSIVAEHENELFQLMVFEPETGPEGSWITKSVTFESGANQLEFEVHSFHEPRTISVSLDGEPHTTFEAPAHWDNVRIDLPESRDLRTVTLATNKCLAPNAVSESADQRCLSFQIRGLPLKTFELYNLSQDPGAEHDLARSNPDLKRLLVGRLRAFEFAPVAEPQSEELSDKAREELRALGYLD